MKKLKFIDTMVSLEESFLGQEIYTQLINPDGWEKGHLSDGPHIRVCPQR